MAVKDNQTEFHFPTHLNDEVGMLARAFENKTKTLKNMALYDSLTGLPNRKNLLVHLDEAIARSKCNGSNLAVIFVDMNRFKEINDHYGHDYGDELLVKFSHALKEAIRATDHCARLGGDEFAIIIEGFDGTPVLNSVVNRYKKELNKAYVIKGTSMVMTISAGVAMYPEHGESADELLKYADEAMYKVKRALATKTTSASVTELHQALGIDKIG